MTRKTNYKEKSDADREIKRVVGQKKSNKIIFTIGVILRTILLLSYFNPPTLVIPILLFIIFFQLTCVETIWGCWRFIIGLHIEPPKVWMLLWLWKIWILYLYPYPSPHPTLLFCLIFSPPPPHIIIIPSIVREKSPITNLYHLSWSWFL